MDLGGYIKKLREKRGFSQRQLAYLSGMSNTEISRIESGERKNPSADILKKLAPHLGISIERLYAAAGYLPDGTPKDGDLDQQWPEGIKVLRRAQQKLTPEKRKKMLRLIEAYIRDEEENET